MRTVRESISKLTARPLHDTCAAGSATPRENNCGGVAYRQVPQWHESWSALSVCLPLIAARVADPRAHGTLKRGQVRGVLRQPRGLSPFFLTTVAMLDSDPHISLFCRGATPRAQEILRVRLQTTMISHRVSGKTDTTEYESTGQNAFFPILFHARRLFV